ncbi:MAG TPA: hypothetical protein VFV50_19555 [Bdellovibrionales bacterium]|nr:hypothetical protein [Bdellovibrionales bacterium]
MGLTGLVYAYFLYFVPPIDEFSNVASQWQPLWHELHILFAPALIFGIGMIWLVHAWTKFKNKNSARRRTGIFLLLSAWPMIMSGVIIQVVTEPAASGFWKSVHLWTSIFWLIGYGLHLVSRKTALSP